MKVMRRPGSVSCIVWTVQKELVVVYHSEVLLCVHSVSKINEAEDVLPGLTLRSSLKQRPKARSISVVMIESRDRETSIRATASKNQTHGQCPAQHGRQHRLYHDPYGGNCSGPRIATIGVVVGLSLLQRRSCIDLLDSRGRRAFWRRAHSSLSPAWTIRGSHDGAVVAIYETTMGAFELSLHHLTPWRLI